MGGTWHRWTQDEIDIVRRDYAHTHASRRQIAGRLGVTEFAVAGIISKLGIAKRDDRRPWTDPEARRLIRLMETLSTRKVAPLMHRSINSINLKAKRLGISRRNRDGWFTKRDVCAMLGVDHHWVQRRIDSGALKATSHYGPRPEKLGSSAWHITEAALKEFIRRYPEEINARNVDFILVVDILAGVINGHPDNHHYQKGEEEDVLQCESGRHRESKGDQPERCPGEGADSVRPGNR